MNSIAAGRNKIVRLFAAYGDAGAVIDELSRRLNVGEKDTAEGLTEAFMVRIDRAETLRLIEAWRHGGVKDKAKAEKLAAVSEAGFPAEMYENYKTAFLTQKGEPYAKAGDRETLKHYAALPESAAAEAERILALEDKLKSVRLLASTRAVLFLAEDLISGYTRFKKVRSKMDYEDLIVLTRALLENRAVADWVLFKLDGGIDHVLIDEAQDTSPDQWAIVKALTADFLPAKARVRQCGRYLPSEIGNSRFTVFRVRIRAVLTKCENILLHSRRILTRFIWMFLSVRRQRFWIRLTNCFVTRRLPKAWPAKARTLRIFRFVSATEAKLSFGR